MISYSLTIASAARSASRTTSGERGDHAPSSASILLLAQALDQPIWVLFFDTERRTSATRLIRALFECASAPIRRAIVMFARRLAKTPATST